MANFSITSLKARNFKGLKSFDFTPEGNDVDVFGDNATGKTTLADISSWLLYGYDSTGEATFGIKPSQSEGSPDKPVESEAEGTFDFDGKEIRLKKIYREKWTKPRGAFDHILTGNTTDYFIDDLPMKMSDYKAEVAKFAGTEERFKMLTNPHYLAGKMSWSDRRKTLFEIFGELTDEEIIASDKEFVDLPALLDGKSCEDRQKIIKATQAKVAAKKKGVPDRIDEQQRSMPEVNVSFAAAEESIVRLEKMIEAKSTEVANIKAGKGDVKIQVEIDHLQMQKDKLIREFDEKTRLKKQGREAAVSLAKKDVALIEEDIKAEEKRIESLREDIELLVETNAALRVSWDTIASERITKEACPTCGQTVPDEKFLEIVSAANIAKAEKLEKIEVKGADNKAKIKQLENKIAEKVKLVDEYKEKLESNKKRLATHEFDLISITKEPPSITNSIDYMAVVDKKTRLEEELKAMQEDDTEDTLKVLLTEIETLKAQLKENNGILHQIKQIKEAKIRIDMLKAEEKQLARDYETLSGQLNLIERFINMKVSLLEENINKHFKTVKFKLFDYQINGGINLVCEVTSRQEKGKPWVTWNDLNSGGKIQAGLEIISVLSEHFKFWPAVFIDNAESVTSLPKMKCQMIRLVVDKNSRKLMVTQA